MDERDLREVTSLIREVAKEFGESDAFYVGGFPRSVVMRAPASDIHDLDIATASVGKAVQLAGLVAEKDPSTVYDIKQRTQTVTLDFRGVELDFQGPMIKDFVNSYMRKAGIEVTPLNANIYGRDFTINALAIPVTRPGVVLDVTKRGVPDVTEGRIASVIPPELAVPEDPLHITRAVRFAGKYGFKIDEELWAVMKDNLDLLRKKIQPRRLAIEAFSMAKYDTEDILKDLGAEFGARGGIECRTST
jgi:tRNA nucleotidyltransferase/poly(A) polymerase